MTKENIRAQFESISKLKDKEIRLDEAALVIAAETESEIKIDYSLDSLDELARKFENSFDYTTEFGVSVASLIDFIHKVEGFSGNVRNYYDPKNSYLNRVIETRTGIPITLALVHISLGDRLNIPVKGINFPGHFLVKYGSDHHLIVDPFTGRILSESDCGTLLKQIAGPKAIMQQEYFDIAENKDILVRILDNLKQIFWREKSWDQSKSCIERLILLRPNHDEFSVQLGAVYEMQGDLPMAQYTYTTVLQQSENEQLRKLASKRLLAMQGSSPTIH